jgi:hypothetical protein
MPGIVEAQEAKATPLGFGVEGGRLGRFHLGAISAEPNDARRSGLHWRASAKGDTPLIREFPDHEKLRLSVRHNELASDDATRGPRLTERRLRCSRTRGLDRAGA